MPIARQTITIAAKIVATTAPAPIPPECVLGAVAAVDCACASWTCAANGNGEHLEETHGSWFLPFGWKKSYAVGEKATGFW